MTTSAFFCRLDHEAVLAVRGPEAAKFLQGQLTCNLNYLSATASSLGARCTPKGRMTSSFRILPEGDGYLLALDGDLRDSQLADLKKYIVFSKATIADESAEWQRFGLGHCDALPAELAALLPEENDAIRTHEHLLAIRLPGARAELWTRTAQAGELQQQLCSLLREGSLNDWRLAQIRAGIGQVVGATRELFIPQMINLQAVGGVSFKKGCYTGQEIVARMQYLGKLKRRLYRLSLTGPAPAAGSELFSPVHGSSVGEVVLAADAGNGQCELLAVLQEDAVSDGRIHLNSLEGPALQLLELPYTLNADQEIQR